MNWEQYVISHGSVAILSVMFTIASLKHVFGWVPKFQHEISLELAHLRHAVFGVSAAPSLQPTPQAPQGGAVPPQSGPASSAPTPVLANP